MTAQWNGIPVEDERGQCTSDPLFCIVKGMGCKYVNRRNTAALEHNKSLFTKALHKSTAQEHCDGRDVRTI